MKELFDLVDKYGFKAPLAGVSEDFDIKHFTRMCNALDISEIALEVATSIFIEVTKFEEQIASLDYLESKTLKTATAIRRNLKLLEDAGLVESTFVTTDKEKKRRGRLYILKTPSSENVTSFAKKEEPEDFKLVKQDQVDEIDVSRTNMDLRFSPKIVTQYLVKAMRTNKKDRSKEINIDVPINQKDKLSIVARAEGNRLMHVRDTSYYNGAITWLFYHLSHLLKNDLPITETYTLPIDGIVSLGKKIPMSEATSGGYIDNAIEAMIRTSVTSFEMSDIPEIFSGTNMNIKSEYMAYKLFRIEHIVSFESDGHVKKAAVMQFPKSAIDSLVWAIKTGKPYEQFLLIDDDLFNATNEIEILFGLWAREKANSGAQSGRSYNWNEARELIAPGTPLDEFKRKFSKLITDNYDPTYDAKIDERCTDQISEIKTGVDETNKEIKNLVYTGNGRKKYIMYGRATVQGFLINVGYSGDKKTTQLFFRRDLSALAYSRGGINIKQISAQ